ncbi:MAG: flagellar filament capping protein FliD [Anaeromusa sp.]|uniref:flagellar filament capping protein FliD n=1 Tax=Anaeromusa sp. TaxID=1872520 RepID=UPI002B1F7973|nr:flagellar filament capping protein FliD [Anaeromusa sp.]MEA4835982.1 flagellar filament capping protein FliD [Anaeromusa sp.]
MRMYGLSGSGMDVDSMVKGLMKAANVPLDKLNQKKTLLQWKKDDYTTIHKTISDFRNKVFDYKLQKTLSPQKVVSTDETVVTASSGGGVPTVAHKIEVTTLATGASAISTDKAAIVPGADGVVDRSSLEKQFGMAAGTEGKLVINGKEITIKSSDSIYAMVNSINQAGAGVQANYDSTLERFFLSTNTTGASMKIDLAGSDATALSFMNEKLKMTTLVDRTGAGTVADPYVYAAGTALAGKDAAFTLDGQALTQATNSFTISGISYTLKKENASATVAVTTDVDKAVENVKAFIDSYNATLASIYTEVNEKYNKNYAPLTSEQKSSMSDEDIKAWEKTAKTGLLSNDSILRTLTTELRGNIATPISGVTSKYNSMSAIGITSGKYYENGKLYLNETQLRTALQEDPNVLSNLFSTDGDDAAKDGVAVRIYDSLKVAMDQINKSAGVLSGSKDTESAIAKELTQINKNITSTSARVSAMQERYYKQFDAMETMLQRMSQQSSWLSQQFSK